jgi:hypothetical protein
MPRLQNSLEDMDGSVVLGSRGLQKYPRPPTSNTPRRTWWQNYLREPTVAKTTAGRREPLETAWVMDCWLPNQSQLFAAVDQ